jgi:hypothetical protein
MASFLRAAGPSRLACDAEVFLVPLGDRILESGL